MAQEVDPNMYTYPFQLTKTIRRDPYDELLPSQPSNSQKGKIIIVTGAYGGIGIAIASVWARAGASVVLAGRKLEELAKVEEATKAVATDPSAKIISISVDITIESEVQNLFTQIQETFGRSADILVNNAGARAVTAPVADIPWDNFTDVFSTHFLGATLMTKYFIKTQPTPDDPVGTVIFITSALSAVMMPGFSTYSIAKLAGQRLMEYLDVEYSRLRTFTLAPGIIKTGLTTDLFRPFARDHAELPGMMCLYLAQERADFLKGGFVSVNWDVKEMEEHKDEILEKKLLKIQWLPAKLGEGGHPFGAQSA